MFSFDHWARWLETKAEEARAAGFDSKLTRELHVPETDADRSVALNVDWPEHGLFGCFAFWERGLCDFHVQGDDGPVVSEMMLDANDDTISQLFDRFMGYFGGQPNA